MTLDINNDPMGMAITDYLEKGKAKKLWIHSSMFEDDTMPVKNLFRNENEMPEIERCALDLCRGKVLDVGAGAGCHSLVLQQRNFECTSIDISPLSVQAMQKRGVRHAICTDFYSDNFGSFFDTILLLMNGIGIAGSLQNLPRFLQRAKELLAPGGCILVDSSDLRYLYINEDGEFEFDETNSYYGEVDYQMSYGSCQGNPFNWLYADFDSLAQAALCIGMKTELIKQGPHYDFLARLS